MKKIIVKEYFSCPVELKKFMEGQLESDTRGELERITSELNATKSVLCNLIELMITEGRLREEDLGKIFDGASIEKIETHFKEGN